MQDKMMPKYAISFAGREDARRVLEADDVDTARNEAVSYLSEYLAQHPGFADEGRWRVNVDDADGKSILHVFVATLSLQHPVFPPPERSLYENYAIEKV